MSTDSHSALVAELAGERAKNARLLRHLREIVAVAGAECLVTADPRGTLEKIAACARSWVVEETRDA